VAGELISDTDPLGHTTTYGYDNDARLASVTDPLGHSTSYGYDPNNRSSSVTDPLGRFVIYQDDALGRVASTRLYSGIFTHQTFDAVGRLSTTSDGLGNTTSYAYDDAGRQISMTDPNGHTTSYGYDAAGRQTSITDALGGKVTIAYDLAGQKTSVVNPRGDSTSFTYDALGDLLTQTDPAGAKTIYTYDLAGRQTSKTDPRGVVVSNTYDAGDRLTSQLFPGGSNTFVYDALGRRTSMTDPTGTTNFTFDAASRLTSVAAPGGTVSYGYDTASNRTSMTLPARGSVTYSYDAANELTSLKDWAGNLFAFTYAPDGMPSTISRSGGVNTSYGYDGADRLTSVHHDGPSGPIAHYDYTLDANGNRTAMTTAAGTESYTLDALNRLTAVSYANGDNASYTYDAAGNRLSTTFNGSTTNYSYDSAGRLTSQGGKAITYDAAGNTTSIGSDTYGWDWAGRLVSSTVKGLSSTYTYDGGGVRVGQTIAGSTTNYLWDRAGSLPLLVDDGTQGYVQTDQGLLEQLGSTAAYPLADALGSVRNLATPSATVTSSTTYDAFGALRSQSGQQSIFGFTGQQTDPTGLSFLRARYYDATLGRFLSPDSVQPNAPDSQGYDLYSYVANTPTSAGDPSGQTLTEEIEDLTTKARAIVGGVALGTLVGRVLLAVRIALEVASQTCELYFSACATLIGLGALAVGVKAAELTASVTAPHVPQPSPKQPPSEVVAPAPDQPGRVVISFKEVGGEKNRFGEYYKPKFSPNDFALGPADVDGLSTYELQYLKGVKPYLVGFTFVVVETVDGPQGMISSLPTCWTTYTPWVGGPGHWSIRCGPVWDDSATQNETFAYAKVLQKAKLIPPNPKFTQAVVLPFSGP
ncbi:MAG TPA: RHS repeat-associated core domain-containing protein, partial [Candidatus Dormibacteraeota bacterium]|nr:RHS repeat-associated core domain-containing protein [Candidatus Dormibacteraeota bacterium]